MYINTQNQSRLYIQSDLYTWFTRYYLVHVLRPGSTNTVFTVSSCPMLPISVLSIPSSEALSGRLHCEHCVSFFYRTFLTFLHRGDVCFTSFNRAVSSISPASQMFSTSLWEFCTISDRACSQVRGLSIIWTKLLLMYIYIYIYIYIYMQIKMKTRP
jgi:hypothetical protein